MCEDDKTFAGKIASRMLRRIVTALLLTAALAACHRIPKTSPPAVAVFYLAEPALDDVGLITIDTSSLRPSRSPAGTTLTPLVTTYLNGRYHPETIRAIAADSSVIATTSRQLMVQSGPGGGLILDFQDVPPEDLRPFTSLLRDITTLARSSGRTPVGLIVPPQDTLSYPTQILSRVVDALIVRAYGDHRPGTLPGAPTTAEFITRSLGVRSVALGPARVIAGLPLFGYRWDRSGNGRVISYAQAAASLNAESGAFRRDPATQFLVATGRDGWTAWVPDGRTIEYLIGVARRSGISAIALIGSRGAAPDIADHVAVAIRR
jgi:hypothetical protein